MRGRWRGLRSFDLLELEQLAEAYDRDQLTIMPHTGARLLATALRLTEAAGCDVGTVDDEEAEAQAALACAIKARGGADVHLPNGFNVSQFRRQMEAWAEGTADRSEGTAYRVAANILRDMGGV